MHNSTENGGFRLDEALAVHPPGAACPRCGDTIDRKGRCPTFDRLGEHVVADEAGAIDVDAHLARVAAVVGWARRRPLPA